MPAFAFVAKPTDRAVSPSYAHAGGSAATLVGVFATATSSSTSGSKSRAQRSSVGGCSWEMTTAETFMKPSPPGRRRAFAAPSPARRSGRARSSPAAANRSRSASTCSTAAGEVLVGRVQRRVAADLAQRRLVGADDGSPGGHRLDDREAEALEAGGKEQAFGVSIETRELAVCDT